MANPTSNFNWQMPANSDLVKDLPADFEVFGQAVDTSLMDLKGGTSGQILSKNSNTDMDFVWINNDQGDITGITATSPLTGGGSSGAITVGIQSASTTQSGAVQLTDSTASTSTTTAATPNSVKTAYDLAAAAVPNTRSISTTSPLAGGGALSGNLTLSVGAGSTLTAGVLQLTDSTSSTSTTTAATPNSVKSAYDLANAAIPKSLADAAGDIFYATANDTVTRLGIGTAGQVLTVNSGATAPEWKAAAGASDISVRCKAGTTATSFTTTYTSIAFDAEDFDTDSMHSTSTNNTRITINTAGKYIIGSSIVTGGNISMGIRLLLNGTTNIAEHRSGNGGEDSRDISTLYDFAVNDYIEVQCISGSTTTSVQTGTKTNFWAKKI